MTPPDTCPEHPLALIRHTWDEKYCVLNGLPAGVGLPSNHKYECSECGRELSDGKHGRDPRIDPQQGDVLEKNGTRTVIGVWDGRAEFLDITGQWFQSLEAWREWAKDAAVLWIGLK